LAAPFASVGTICLRIAWSRTRIPVSAFYIEIPAAFVCNEGLHLHQRQYSHWHCCLLSGLDSVSFLLGFRKHRQERKFCWHYRLFWRLDDAPFSLGHRNTDRKENHLCMRAVVYGRCYLHFCLLMCVCIVEVEPSNANSRSP
jgi:hypothetical protein